MMQEVSPCTPANLPSLTPSKSQLDSLLLSPWSTYALPPSPLAACLANPILAIKAALIPGPLRLVVLVSTGFEKMWYAELDGSRIKLIAGTTIDTAVRRGRKELEDESALDMVKAFVAVVRGGGGTVVFSPTSTTVDTTSTTLHFTFPPSGFSSKSSLDIFNSLVLTLDDVFCTLSPVLTLQTLSKHLITPLLGSYSSLLNLHLSADAGPSDVEKANDSLLKRARANPASVMMEVLERVSGATPQEERGGRTKEGAIDLVGWSKGISAAGDHASSSTGGANVKLDKGKGKAKERINGDAGGSKTALHPSARKSNLNPTPSAHSTRLPNPVPNSSAPATSSAPAARSSPSRSPSPPSDLGRILSHVGSGEQVNWDDTQPAGTNGPRKSYNGPQSGQRVGKSRLEELREEEEEEEMGSSDEPDTEDDEGDEGEQSGARSVTVPVRSPTANLVSSQMGAPSLSKERLNGDTSGGGSLGRGGSGTASGSGSVSASASASASGTRTEDSKKREREREEPEEPKSEKKKISSASAAAASRLKRMRMEQSQRGRKIT